MVYEENMIERIPFIHRDKLYYIISREDITFAALHYILDILIDQCAFNMDMEDPELYTVVFEGEKYTIGVDGIDLMITTT